MSFLKKMVKSAGKGIHVGISVYTAPTRLAGKVTSHIPVVGKPLQTVINLPNAPLRLADSISQGNRLDKAVIDNIKKQIKDYKEIAPYAQMVISVVPGVGTVASGAIGAGIALSSGQPITKAIEAGIKGSLPGGPIAASVFDAASAAVQGKSLANIGIAALPIPDEQKKAVTATYAFAHDVAQGKKVSSALMAQAEKNLPPDIRKAMTVGLAVAQGKKLQLSMLATVTPSVLNNLSEHGKKIAASNAMLKAGEKLAGNVEAQKGYHVATSVMNQKVTPLQVVAVRNKLNPDQQKGFDLAAAAHIGAQEGVKTDLKDPKAQFAFAATHGVADATNDMKKKILAPTLADSSAKAGTVEAAQQVAAATISKRKGGWWHQFLVKIRLAKDE